MDKIPTVRHESNQQETDYCWQESPKCPKRPKKKGKKKKKWKGDRSVALLSLSISSYKLSIHICKVDFEALWTAAGTWQLRKCLLIWVLVEKFIVGVYSFLVFYRTRWVIWHWAFIWLHPLQTCACIFIFTRQNKSVPSMLFPHLISLHGDTFDKSNQILNKLV